MGGISQTFDNNGNLIVNGTNNYSYNNLNQLTAVNTTLLKYDALNRLIKVSAPNDTTAYNYSFLNAIEIKKTGNDISNVFGNGLDALKSIKNNGQQYYTMQNNVNSVTGITDSANHLTEHYEYEPFGASHTFNNGYSGIPNSSIGNEIQFGGRHYIASTGVYNFRFRYLDIQQGRFIQRDPLKYTDGMNLFSYVGNNTVSNIDPLGLSETLTDKSNKQESSNGQSVASNIATLTEYVGFFIYNDAFWLGKNGKYYTETFSGNKYTGGRLNFARRYKNWFDIIGIGLSGLEVYENYKMCQNGKITFEEMNRRNFEIGKSLIIDYILGDFITAYRIGYSIGTFIYNYSDFISSLPGTPTNYDYDAHPHPAKFY